MRRMIYYAMVFAAGALLLETMGISRDGAPSAAVPMTGVRSGGSSSAGGIPPTGGGGSGSGVGVKKVVPNRVVELPDGVTLEMVWIPPGTFMMGSSSDPGRSSNEGPAHMVRITKGFYLGKYEVTEGQWASVMGGRPAQPDMPKTEISWNDAQAFVDSLNRGKKGEVYRLPTEAEWEYACRSKTKTPWSFGDDVSVLGEYAWYAGNAMGSKHAVGGKRANGWGLHDMHGNVLEWVRDGFGLYGAAPQVDPAGPVSGQDRASQVSRVMRGGSFSSAAQDVRSATRSSGSPDSHGPNIGMRLLRQGPPL